MGRRDGGKVRGTEQEGEEERMGSKGGKRNEGRDGGRR